MNKPEDHRKVVKIRSIYGYDYMCSEMDFKPEQPFSSNYKNSHLLLTAAAALSQNGQIAV